MRPWRAKAPAPLSWPNASQRPILLDEYFMVAGVVHADHYGTNGAIWVKQLC